MTSCARCFSALALVAGLAFSAACGGSEPAKETRPGSMPAAPAPKAPAAAPAKRPAPAPSARRPRATDAPAAHAPEPAAPSVEAAPELGILRIDSDVPGAQIFIDREFVGAAPFTANNITPGQHRLNVSAEGYEGIAQTIDVEPGPRDITFRFKEVRLSARIDVVHKHRMGSCKGTLIATAQGLRYDTTEKGDAFSAGLLDLDTFQVDYLEKNLKVKTKKGKQFNFTDPEGNADRLFVFHRDVEKARDRLKKGDVPASD